MSKKSYSFVEEPSLRRSKADRRARELLTSTVRAHTGRHTHAEWRRRAEEYYKQAGLLSEDSEFSARQPITYGPQGLIEGITDSNLERIILEQLSDDGAFDTVVPIDLARKKERGVGKTRFSSSQKYRGKQAGQSESKASWATVKVAFNPLSYMAATYQGRDAVRVGTAFDYCKPRYGTVSCGTDTLQIDTNTVLGTCGVLTLTRLRAAQLGANSCSSLIRNRPSWRPCCLLSGHIETKAY